MASTRNSYRWIVLALLAFIYVLNFLDRQLLAILAKPIQDELGVSDGQLGLLGGFYFALFYCTISLPVAWLADRRNRVLVVATACAIWSLATLACGLSRSYGELVAARMAVGIGEAGGVPPSYSIVSDYFGPLERGRALAIFNLGAPFGQALGVAFGAAAATAFGWRTAFIVMGIVGIFAAVLLAIIVREPARGASEEVAPAQARSERPIRDLVKAVRAKPALLLTALASGVSAFISYALLNFAVLFLMREKGMSLEEVGLYYALMLAVAIGGGIYASGWIIDRFAARGDRIFAIVPMAALFLAIPFFIAFVEADDWRVAMLFLILPTFLGYFFLTPAVTFTQKAVRPDQRTLASALLLFLMNMIGLGLGPTYVGAMSDFFGKTDPANSLQLAFHSVLPFFLLAILLYWLVARSIGRDATRATDMAPRRG